MQVVQVVPVELVTDMDNRPVVARSLNHMDTDCNMSPDNCSNRTGSTNMQIHDDLVVPSLLLVLPISSLYVYVAKCRLATVLDQAQFPR